MLLADWASLSEVWVDGGLHVRFADALCWIEVLEGLAEAKHLVLFFLVDRHWEGFYITSGHDLSASKSMNASFVVPQANLLDGVNPEVLETIHLSSYDLLSGVNSEVRVVDNHFLVEIVDFLLLSFLLFLLGVVSQAREDCLEVIWLREGLSGSYFTVKVRLSIFASHKLVLLQLCLGLLDLHVVGHLQCFYCRVVRLLWVLVPVLSFHHVVKAILGLPSGLVVLFLLDDNLVLVHQRESQTEEVFGVGIEVSFVFGNLLAHLFLLDLPDVQLLVTVEEDLHVIWNVQSFLQWLAGAHCPQRLHVLVVEVGCSFHPSLVERRLEVIVVVDCVALALAIFSFVFDLDLRFVSANTKDVRSHSFLGDLS